MEYNNLWYFWDGPALPPVCSLGIKSLVYHATGLRVFHLNCQNIKDYLPQMSDDWMKLKKWAHRVDYLRPRILYKYGGIFVDVDVVCLEDLSILLEEIDKSDTTLMADELRPRQGPARVLAVGLIVAKPNSPMLAKYADAQDSFLRKNNFQVTRWHGIGANLLNDCRLSGHVYPIKYQRPCCVVDTKKTFLSHEKWTKFVRKTKGIPKPVVWPTCWSSYLKCPTVSQISEHEWIHGKWMLSSAFRYALRVNKVFI